MKIKEISVLCFAVSGVLSVHVACAQVAPWNPIGGVSPQVGGALKTAPIFDPIIHQQVKINTNHQITIGATDTDGDFVKLQAIGPAVQGAVQIINQQGRAEMKITLKSLIAQQSVVNLVATDATGLVTKRILNIRFVPVVNDLPAVLSAIEHQTMKLGETLKMNVEGYDPDPAVLNMQAILPNNGAGAFNVTTSAAGYVSGRITWTPAQAGVFDIPVRVNNVAGAAVGSLVDGFIRVIVKNPAASNTAAAPNSPAVFEPLETRQYVNTQPQAIKITANDIDNDLVTLFATGPSVVNFQQVVNIQGKAVGIVTLNGAAVGADSYEVISLTAVDQKGNVTVVDLPVDLRKAINNEATTLIALPVQTAFVNQPFTMDISASDLDMDALDLKVAAPLGNSQFLVANNIAPGFVIGTFTWTPQAPGVYHIPVFAFDVNAGRNNAAYGILEVRVQ